MKIAVSAEGAALYSHVAHSFGRCPYFIIVDPISFECEEITNPNLVSLGGGIGVQTAGLLAEKGVSVILTGKCGPIAIEVYGHKGIKIVQNIKGPVKQAIQKYYSSNSKDMSSL